MYTSTDSSCVGTSTYSPIMMDVSWGRSGRLSLTCFITLIACILNGFFISAFNVSRMLQTSEYQFLTATAAADLFITVLVLPITSTVMLSNAQIDVLAVCVTQQCFIGTSTLFYSLASMFMMVEMNARVRRRSYATLIYNSILCINCIALFISILTTILGNYLELNNDYCTREKNGVFAFKLSIDVAFYVIPAIVIMFSTVDTYCELRRVGKLNARSRQHNYENQVLEFYFNLIGYLMFVGSWLPFIIVVYKYPKTCDTTFYPLVYIGILRPILTHTMYFSGNKYFRRAFVYLFNYCFFKNTLPLTYRQDIIILNNNTPPPAPPPLQLVTRVNIMHSAFNYNNYNRQNPRQNQIREAEL